MSFAPATKEQAKARIALVGPAGSGKTYTSLLWAAELGERVAVIDTEHGSASKYADLFTFDTDRLTNFRPANYITAAREAEASEYDVLVIDSLSHAWAGKGGLLEQVDDYGRTHGGNNFAGWRDATPQHMDLIESLLALRMHLIVTMRSKTEYLVQQNARGKAEPVKVGTAPVQRDGMEYEFDVVADLTVENVMSIGKTRCPALRGLVAQPAGADVAKTVLEWLSDGRPPPTADDLRERALEGWDDANALLRVLSEARYRGLATVGVKSYDGASVVPLEDFISVRGRELRP